MPITLKDKMKELSPAQRKKVEARAAELIAEEMTLRELRHARKLTQVKIAKKLGVTQDSVSRLEKRSDLLLSTLRKTVEAMGGNLSLVYDWAASTGREKYETSPLGQRAFTATPAGFYQFDPNRMYRQYRSRAWDGAMPYAMFLNWERGGVPTGVAVHATTRSTIGRLGKRASAGCIHISAENAALLYKTIRADYRGQVPRFAYDEDEDAISNRGELMRNAAGQLEMTEGFRVLIDIEKFSGRDVVTARN